MDYTISMQLHDAEAGVGPARPHAEGTIRAAGNKEEMRLPSAEASAAADAAAGGGSNGGRRGES